MWQVNTTPVVLEQATILAHEFRSPLAAILSAVRVFRRAHREDAQMLDAVRIIEQQALQLARLVDALLTATAAGSGKLLIQREDVNLVEILSCAVEACRPALDALGQRLVLSQPLVPVSVAVDRLHMTQVAINILDNATKYSPPGGTIRVAISSDSATARISFKDDGIGIHPSRQRHIFEMFVQVAPATPQASRGLGIGLSLAKRLVELHEGSIEVHSEGEGKGSTFIVSLPLRAVGTTGAS